MPLGDAAHLGISLIRSGEQLHKRVPPPNHGVLHFLNLQSRGKP